jgi:hypothetical protein
LWYLHKSVALTEDNLDSTGKETKHISFVTKMRQLGTCSLNARVLTPSSYIIHMALGLIEPGSISHMFGGWMGNFKELIALVLLEAAATC